MAEVCGTLVSRNLMLTLAALVVLVLGMPLDQLGLGPDHPWSHGSPVRERVVTRTQAWGLVRLRVASTSPKGIENI